jgi:hypothetical protein
MSDDLMRRRMEYWRDRVWALEKERDELRKELEELQLVAEQATLRGMKAVAERDELQLQLGDALLDIADLTAERDRAYRAQQVKGRDEV